MTQTNDGGATDLTTDALKRLAKAITPGPWNWQVNRQSRSMELSGGRQTKAGGDLTVMSFARWGLQGAAPVFWTWTGNIAEEVQRADEIAVPEPGREHHAGWFARIDHPDAELIALAPALLREVIDRRGAEAGMRALLRTGCDLLADEYDNLKASVTMPDGSLSASPLDAWAVEKVAAMDDWIASVKATLYRATPTTEASHERE